MRQMIESFFLYIICFVLVLMHFDINACVIASLCAMIANSFIYYADNGRNVVWIGCVLAFFVYFQPAIGVFLPVIAYGYTDKKFSVWQKVIVYLFIAAMGLYMYSLLPGMHFMALAIVTVLGTVIGMAAQRIEELQEVIMKNRDADRELQLLLEQKNADLIEKSHYEIEMATLKERNRIAREIHDNVGHLLTRSILQVGALNMINKNTELTMHYEQLSATLNQAMDTIRASVHNLYNTGIDLKSSIEGFIENIAEPKIELQYEAQQIPHSVAYHFIAIIKEAINNTMKHSDADKIRITVLEHPCFYQLTIEDNGMPAKKIQASGESEGMGISSMQERIESLKGTMKIFTESGFKIFITVMKKEREDEHINNR